MFSFETEFFYRINSMSFSVDISKYSGLDYYRIRLMAHSKYKNCKLQIIPRSITNLKQTPDFEKYLFQRAVKIFSMIPQPNAEFLLFI